MMLAIYYGVMADLILNASIFAWVLMPTRRELAEADAMAVAR